MKTRTTSLVPTSVLLLLLSAPAPAAAQELFRAAQAPPLHPPAPGDGSVLGQGWVRIDRGLLADVLEAVMLGGEGALVLNFPDGPRPRFLFDAGGTTGAPGAADEAALVVGCLASTDPAPADPAPADQAPADQGSADQGSADQGSADQGSADQGSAADPAPAEDGARGFAAVVVGEALVDVRAVVLSPGGRWREFRVRGPPTPGGLLLAREPRVPGPSVLLPPAALPCFL